MKVSINRANKLRNSLEALSFNYESFVTVRTNQSLAAAEDIVAKGEAAFQTVIANLKMKSEMVMTLRNLIFEANISHGIVPIIAEIARIEGLIKSYSTTMVNAGGYSARLISLDDFKSKLEYRQKVEAKAVDNVLQHETLSINVLKPGIQLLDEELKILKLTLNERQEERNRKNHENYIELPDDLVEFLRVHALMA